MAQPDEGTIKAIVDAVANADGPWDLGHWETARDECMRPEELMRIVSEGMARAGYADEPDSEELATCIADQIGERLAMVLQPMLLESLNADSE